jgi:hypothetical protein
MGFTFKLKLDNIIFTLILLLSLSRQEIFFVPIKGQRIFMGGIITIALFLLSNPMVKSLIVSQAKNFIFINIYLFVILLLGFGNTSDILTLQFTYLLGTAFFVIGFYWGLFNKGILLKELFLLLFIATFLNIIPFVFFTIKTGTIAKLALAQYYGFGAESYFIMFWPQIFSIGFVGFFINQTRIEKNWHKIALYLLFAVYAITMVISAYTAVILMLVLSIIVMFLIKLKDKLNFARIVVFTMAFLIIMFMLTKISDGSFGDLGGSADKVKAFLMIFESSDKANFEEQLEVASATRYSRLDVTFASITKSPIIGNGYYFESVGDDESKAVASAHSSVLDFLAYFGLFAIPFYLIFINFIRVSFKLSLTVIDYEKQLWQALCASFVTYFLISFSNPYLQHSSIDLIFLLGGFTLGQSVFLKGNEKKSQPTNTI